ncbi:hypothetical protein GGI12_001270 [Dipsacomyces acuminosporus]|nr:hypothetical protein GGI12_001270 [Dipsacomyces acuminosporus]
MAGTRKRTGMSKQSTNKRGSQDDTPDEWAPSDSELGHTLSQVLRGPARKVQPSSKARTSGGGKPAAAAKPDSTEKRLPPVPPLLRTRAQTKALGTKAKQNQTAKADTSDGEPCVVIEKVDRISTSRHAEKQLLQPVGEPAGVPEADNRQKDEIVAMFDDAEDERLLTNAKATDTGNDALPIGHGASPASLQMEFVGEESRMNCRNLLDAAKHNKSRSRETRKSTKRSGAMSKSSSGDDFPDDPLSPAPRSQLHPAKRHGKRPWNQISSAEATEEEESTVLDPAFVLGQRLRPKASKTGALSRLEQARQNMRNTSYDTETETETEEIDQYASQTDTRDLIDLPESKNEAVQRHSSALVIRDSGDEDDDYISEPEDAHSEGQRYGGSSGGMDKFLGLFGPRYRKHMQKKARRHLTTSSGGNNNKSNNPGASSRFISPSKRNEGYSKSIDDDIADFIVDDEGGGDEIMDDDDVLNRQAAESATAEIHDELSRHDLPSSFKAYTQYLVYWVANGHRKPEFEADIERYFYYAYITVSRVTDSLEQSLVSSTAWVDSFRNSLYRYPELASSHIPGTPGCEACHFHYNRTATFCITLSGTPYDRELLIPPYAGTAMTQITHSRPKVVTIGDSDDSASESSHGEGDSGDSEDSNSHEQKTVSFNVGRLCNHRAKVWHELYHYFYHLANAVEVALNTLDTNVKDADPADMVSMLDDQGTLDNFFEDFKDLLSRAKSGFAK